MIKDSGSRTEFETGAIRDIQEGKGRCDLLPLDVVAHWLKYTEMANSYETEIILCIERYQNGEGTSQLYKALDIFTAGNDGFVSTVDAILEVSKHFEEGAKKYGENNWKKGIPESSYIDSAVRHYLKWLRNDDDEQHDRAFIWNIMCLIWTHEHATCKMPAWIDGIPTAKLENHGKCVETSCYYNNDCTCTAPPAALVDETAGKECPQYSED